MSQVAHDRVEEGLNRMVDVILPHAEQGGVGRLWRVANFDVVYTLMRGSVSGQSIKVPWSLVSRWHERCSYGGVVLVLSVWGEQDSKLILTSLKPRRQRYPLDGWE